jgi:hypothetical protein
VSRRAAIIIGAGLFAAGGVLLAFGGNAGVMPGTVCGLAGLGLLGWTALRRIGP